MKVQTPTQALFDSLPESIVHIGRTASAAQKAKEDPHSSVQVVPIVNVEDEDEEWLHVGEFKINIERVTKQQLICMRRYLPQAEYRLVKNRKSARLCRLKRKREDQDLKIKSSLLVENNLQLEKQIEICKQEHRDRETENFALRQELASIKQLLETKKKVLGGAHALAFAPGNSSASQPANLPTDAPVPI